MIRNTLQEIKKNLRRKYPKPFDVSTSFKNGTTLIMIKDFNKQPVAEFKYIPEDGAILIGYENSPKYRSYYETNFPELHTNEHMAYYQDIIDIFHKNAIFKELFSYKQEPLKLTEDMFKLEEVCILKLDVNTDFKKIAPNGLHISICFQYYVNENFSLTPRMKISFEFEDLGSLILYYDYDTNIIHFGEVQFVDSETFKDFKESVFNNYGPFLLTQIQLRLLGIDLKPVKIIFYEFDNESTYQLMNINKQDPIENFQKLETVFNSWMSEIGILLNKKFAIIHKLDDTFEAEAKDKVIENFNLVKMALI